MSTPRKTVVADHLRQALLRGDHAPGDPLPREEELAERFGVSRGTVRTALRTLEEEGRIVIRQGRGAFVRDYRPIVHLATAVPGGTDAERFHDGYAPHVRAAGYDRVTERITVRIDALRPKVAKRLGLAAPGDGGALEDRLVVVRGCDRFVEGRLWEAQTTHYPYALADGTPLMSPRSLDGGAHAVLRGLGHTETWSWDVVGARMPDPAESAAFGVGPGVALLVQERVAYAGDRATRFTETVMPADRHQLLYADGDAPGELLLLASDVSIFER
jgi:GntR family transcriptional regulator